MVRRRRSRRSKGGLHDTNNIALLLLLGMIGFVFFSSGNATPPNPTVYTCPYGDGYTTTDLNAFNLHLLTNHNIQPTPTPIATPTPSPPPINSRVWWGPAVGGTSWGYTELLTDSMINLVANEGASSIRIMLNKANWTQPDGVYKNYIISRVQHCHSVGLNVLMDLTYDTGTSDGNNQYLYNYKVIASSTLTSEWIAWGTDVINSCKPEAIGVMNEPREGGGVTWNDYYAFVLQSISTYKNAASSAGISNFKIFVQGYPFSDTWRFAGTSVISDTSVIFETHMYYDPFITSGHTAYLTACSEFYAGHISSGTGWLHSYMDYKIAGLPLERVNFAEIGVFNDASHPWSEDPTDYLHWQDWMNAVYDYVEAKGMQGCHQYSLSGWNMYVMIYTSTEQFTPYGQVWADGIPTT
jgi:hypothetical protein